MPPEASIDRLRLLSLAIDDAISRDDLDETFALLERREQCIAELHGAGVSIAAEELRELVAMNDRLAIRLRAGQSRMADDARVTVKAVQAAKAYSSR
ncbi:MAG: hypothetical protein ACO1SV_00165 [Fimbriimonas sp.]